MAQTAFNENRLLENWLLRDYWEPENACWVLLDAIRIEHTLYRLRSGKKISAHMPLDIHSINTAYVKLQDSHKDLLGRWMASKHDYSFSDSFLWERDYCIKWGLSKGVDIPWLDWAIEKRYLPAEIREDKKTKKSDTPMSDREEMRWKVLAAVFFEMLTDSDQANHHFKDAAQLGKVIDATYGVQFPNKGLRSRTLETKFAKLNGQLKELRS